MNDYEKSLMFYRSGILFIAELAFDQLLEETGTTAYENKIVESYDGKRKYNLSVTVSVEEYLEEEDDDDQGEGKGDRGYRPIGIDHFASEGEKSELTEADCLEPAEGWNSEPEY